MYICLKCGSEFKTPIKLTETHSLPNPPYESLYVCPNCKSSDYEEKKVKHCHCCGAKILNGDSDYCSDACKIKGEKLWLKEAARKNLLTSSPIYCLVREADEYNKANKTNYSYGQYVAFVKSKKRIKKNAKN
jgi:hypothetical protein